MNNQPIKILLIDDDEDYFVITREVLNEIDHSKYELSWVSSYEEGLEDIISRNHDIYFIDYRFGAQNGLELIRESLENGCRAPMILMTGQGDREVDIAAMKAGAADYVSKEQIDASTLERTIRYAIDRTQALEAIRDNEERFRNAFIHAVTGMALAALSGRFLQVNGSLCKMIGYTEQELRANNLHLIVHEESREKLNEILTKLTDSSFLYCEDELVFNHKNGGRVYVILSGRLQQGLGDNPLHFVFHMQDVSAKKQAELALQQSEEQLRQIQKMEAIGRLAGGVAHDFNNILTVITGYSGMLLQKIPDLEDARKHVEEIQKASEQAVGLTRQLLAFSRKQLLNPKLINLNTVVFGMEKMLHRLIGEDVDLRISLEETNYQIKADPGQIEQVVMNLVVNARDAMPLGGKLTIQSGAVTIEEMDENSKNALPAGEYMMLAVSDTGLGMAEQVKEHLFEPFFTTKGVGKGTGLGLATCYGIIQQSDGFIHLYSELGEGTVFKIFLPVVASSIETKAAETEDAIQMKQGVETLLVVEDEDPVRNLAACILRNNGYTVLEAVNGVDALRLLNEQPSRAIDLVVTDVIMPQIGGKELADQLKTLRPDTKILFTSGYTDDALAHRGILEPGLAFLEKPFSPARLTIKVREVLDGEVTGKN